MDRKRPGSLSPEFSAKRHNQEQEEHRVWIRWHSKLVPTLVIVNVDTCNVDEFVTICLSELRKNKVPSNQVVLRGYASAERWSVIAQVIPLKDNSRSNPVVLQPPSEEDIMAYLSGLPSRNEAKQKETECPARIYQHWFALEVYNCFHGLDLNDDSGTISITLNEEKFKINEILLNEFLAEVESITCMSKENSSYLRSIGSNELTHTSVLCRSLDRFLFPSSNDQDTYKGGCIHLLPSCKNDSMINQPDILVCTMESGVPVRLVLAGDYKLNFEEKSFHKTIAYCNKYRGEVILGLSGCSKSFKLLLFQNNGDGKVQVIKMIEIESLAKLREFACILYACVHYLMKPIRKVYLERDVAVKCDQGSDKHHESLTDKHHERLARRVVKCLKSNRVHKFYDSQEFLQCNHNYELIKRLDLLPNVTLERLSPGDRFHRLSYDYIDTKQRSYLSHTLKDFAPLLDKLSKLHEEDFVHSDVCSVNIIFSDNGACLIDFDLVGKEGTVYPTNFNHDLDERHPDALADSARYKEHDRFSLLKCIKANVGLVPAELEELFNSGVPLSTIAEAICCDDRFD